MVEMTPLRRRRLELQLSQEDVVMLTRKLQDEDPEGFRSISGTSLRRLEAGHSKPRARTADTLAKALNQDISLLFPAGIDDRIRNPEGARNRGLDKNQGGRPKKRSMGAT